MKIAIPVFGTRVSPRFDCAQVFLLVTLDGGRTTDRQELAAGEWAPHERINRLVEQGATAVICGGIDWWSAASLHSAGISVHHGVTGEVDHALAAWLRGEVPEAAAAWPAESSGQPGSAPAGRRPPTDGSSSDSSPFPGRMRRCRHRGRRHSG